MQPPAAERFNPVVVAPTYNNAGTLAHVLSRVAAQGVPLIVVNDGSTDATASVLERWAQEHPRTSLLIHTHQYNRGKAAALRSGFADAEARGYTHALTIDTDAQHDPERIGALLDAARSFPDAYVLGVRDMRQADYPARSRIGRRISNLLIRLECGLKVHDSQCGMRVYPLKLVRAVHCRAGRYGYESEMIARAAWAGCRVKEVAVNTRYLPAGQRVSHFRPWVDSARCGVMHARLLLRAVVPLPHRQYSNDGAVPARRRLLPRALLNWINPVRAWRELRAGEVSRNELATALSVGAFVSNLPVYPLQTVTSLYFARRLHLNPLAVLAGSQLSTPPIGPVLIAAAVCLGHLLMHGSLPPWPDFHAGHAPWTTLARPLLLDWVVGAIPCGMVCAAATFALAHAMLRERPDEDDLETPADAPALVEPANREREVVPLEPVRRG